MAAATQPGQAVGYIAVLREFVAELEAPTQHRSGLRSLIAPDLSPADFDAVVDAAQRSEAGCQREGS